jgi:hypothetical protein
MVYINWKMVLNLGLGIAKRAQAIKYLYITEFAINMF